MRPFYSPPHLLILFSFFFTPTPSSVGLRTQLGGKRRGGEGAHRTGLKAGDSAHPKGTPFQQSTPKAAFAASLPWDSRVRPRDARRDKPFRLEGDSNHLGRLTRETCARETVVLPPALTSRYLLILERLLVSFFNTSWQPISSHKILLFSASLSWVSRGVRGVSIPPPVETWAYLSWHPGPAPALRVSRERRGEYHGS